MAQAAAELTNQFLTFSLGDEQFGVDISNVREVLEYDKVTKIPRMPEYMLGVINLRGASVPVFSLRSKFGMELAEFTVDTCIIITEVDGGQGVITVGLLVDSVQEVFDLESDQIEPAPSIGSNIDVEFIKGMGKKDEAFLIIIDTDKIFKTEEIAAVGGQGPVEVDV
jgi:methyl-accepting chemotaxis protein/purine-binding chemotaxis protein CheW